MPCFWSGALVMLAVTSIKLTLVVLLIVPVVVVPILRPAGAAAVARQPGRDRRLWGSCRRDDQRHPHSAGLHPRGASDASRRRQGSETLSREHPESVRNLAIM